MRDFKLVHDKEQSGQQDTHLQPGPANHLLWSTSARQQGPNREKGNIQGDMERTGGEKRKEESQRARARARERERERERER